MFDEIVYEFASSDGRRRRITTWALAAQAVLIGCMILAPLLDPDALPDQRQVASLGVPFLRSAATTPTVRLSASAVRAEETAVASVRLRAPSSIPVKTVTTEQESAPPQLDGAGMIGGVPGGMASSQAGSLPGVIGGILAATPVPVPEAVAPRPKRVRAFSKVEAGNLISRVTPVYPELARQAFIQGVVVLQAEISATGTIENLRVISGNPLLIPSALAAVKQWRYRPYYLSGEAVAVETTIDVNFTMSRN